MRSLRLAAPVLVLAALALAACQPEPDPVPGEAPTATASPVPTTGTVPTAPPESVAPTPAPSAGPHALPADCAHAYSPAMYDRLLAEFGSLNPDVTYLSTKIADLSDVIERSPTLACLWTPPGTTALMTNATVLTAADAEEVRAVLPANFSGCEESGARIVCSRAAEQLKGSAETERVVLSGDLLLTTLALNADDALVVAAVDDMLATISG